MNEAPCPLPVPRPVPAASPTAESGGGAFALLPENAGLGISARSLSRVAAGLAWCSLAISLVIPLLLLAVSESWWLTAVLVYMPRQPWLILPMLAVVFTAIWNRRLLSVALAALIGTAGPIMGFACGGLGTVMTGGPRVAAHAGTVRIVSCNVQAFKPDFPAEADEIASLKPDLVVFQEAFGDHPLVARCFEGWHVLREEEYLVASRWPVSRIGIVPSDTFDRNCAFVVRVQHPAGDFVLANIHLATARFGLKALGLGSILSGEGPAELTDHITRREAEALGTRQWIESSREGLPVIAAGDFNMPVDSNVLEQSFGDLRNTFVEVGVGYGYTAPNKSRTWPQHVPWCRVDHVLVSEEWTIQAVGTGAANGSDHKLVWSVVDLPPGAR